jgi:hypothetical protein
MLVKYVLMLKIFQAKVPKTLKRNRYGTGLFLTSFTPAKDHNWYWDWRKYRCCYT